MTDARSRVNTVDVGGAFVLARGAERRGRAKELWRSMRDGFSPSAVLGLLSGAWWLWPRLREDGSSAVYIHRAYQQEARRRRGAAGEMLRWVAFLAGAPFVLATVVRQTAVCGGRVRRQHGKGRLRQAREQIALWLTRAVLPRNYYIFELYDEAHRVRALEYLFRYETKAAIYVRLREAYSSPQTTEALRSKALFSQHCRAHGVDAIRALFVVADGKLQRLDRDEPGLPAQDLFLKPLSGSAGRGAAVWRCVGEGAYADAAGVELDEAGLIARLQELSRQEPYVGRAYVNNHSEIAEIGLDALCSVRVLSCLDEQGRPQITHAVLRMPRVPGTIVDNFHAGGIAAAVDLESGVLGPATDMGVRGDSQWWDEHPVTGAAIRGRRLPMWPAVLDLAREAHRAFPDHIAIGWDVAILDGGPCLIEGNKSPDLDIVQRVGREPIGNSRFGELLAFHLHRALAPEAAGASRGVAAETAEATEDGGAGVRPPRVIERDADLDATDVHEVAYETLESGGILFLPGRGFELTAREKELIQDVDAILPSQKERESRIGRPTLIFDPARGCIERSNLAGETRREVEAMLERFAAWSEEMVTTLLPEYAASLEAERVTYRPCNRSIPQGMHIDSSYGHPTGGRGMLRLFCNVNPQERPRVWQIGEPFEPFVARVLPRAKVGRGGPLRWLRKLGVLPGPRTAYDRLMADLRRLGKGDQAYQKSAPRRVVEFPSGSCWLAITDLAVHGAISGQHSLDRTFFLPTPAMRSPERSSLRILERLTGRALV